MGKNDDVDKRRDKVIASKERQGETDHSKFNKRPHEDHADIRQWFKGQRRG